MEQTSIQLSLNPPWILLPPWIHNTNWKTVFFSSKCLPCIASFFNASKHLFSGAPGWTGSCRPRANLCLTRECKTWPLLEKILNKAREPKSDVELSTEIKSFYFGNVFQLSASFFNNATWKTCSNKGYIWFSLTMTSRNCSDLAPGGPVLTIHSYPASKVPWRLIKMQN